MQKSGLARRLHPLLGGIALLIIVTFQLSTIVAELFLSHEWIAFVKRAILVISPVLVTCQMATAASGFSMKIRTDWVNKKARRMRFAAANGVFVLIPSAIILDRWASTDRFDTTFFAVQALELLAGSVNIFLVSSNLIDGLRGTGRLGLSSARA